METNRGFVKLRRQSGVLYSQRLMLAHMRSRRGAQRQKLNPVRLNKFDGRPVMLRDADAQR